MMNTLRLVSRQNLRQLHKCVVRRAEASVAAAMQAEVAPPPPPSNSDKPVSPKIDKIANDITALNLIEVAQLSDLLKKRLNLPDVPAMSAIASPLQPVDQEEETTKQVKSSFTVKLLSFDDKQKIALIKEIKSLLPDTNLVQAKKFVESAPTIVKGDIAKDEAEQLRDALVKVGATVEIV